MATAAQDVIRNPFNYERLGTAPNSSPYHGFRIFFPLAPLEKILKHTRFFGFRMSSHHQYREYPSGHTWVTWENALPEALEWVLVKME